MTSFSLLFVVIFLTLTFEFSNGWHDAANSIATVVSTRVLTPFRAVACAGFRALILSGWTKPVLFIFLSPVIGLFFSIVVTIATSWIVRNRRPLKVDRWFRRLQLFSAAAYSLGHGTNDAQKGMGIITTALVAGGLLKTYDVPYWVIICCHLAMGGGTMAGGWRIIKTMG